MPRKLSYPGCLHGYDSSVVLLLSLRKVCIAFFGKIGFGSENQIQDENVDGSCVDLVADTRSAAAITASSART